MSLIHKFSHDIPLDGPTGFTNPFRYVPHPLVREAAGLVMTDLDGLISTGRLSGEVCRGFSEGKMLGVLVCRPQEAKSSGYLIYLAAFSGTVGGQSVIEGFVPPIYDLLDPSGHFKDREAEISAINEQISSMKADVGFKRMELELRIADRDRELISLQEEKSRRKRERELILKEWDADGAERLVYRERFVRESQHENAERKRAKDRWKGIIGPMEAEVNGLEDKIRVLKQQRAGMSEELQKWIFRKYKVMNGLGEESSIMDIFAVGGLVPPGGTGDCAAPKLLDYAFRHGLTPVAMGEFWYGDSPDTAVRTSGHFYPSCTSKCGPLLKYMLRGLTVSEAAGLSSSDRDPLTPEVLYEDEVIIVIDKPSGMPSVPGLDGRESAQEWAERRCEGFQEGVHAVHRLDMDTSGILLLAKTREAYVNLQRQFEERLVRKTYMARLSAGGRKLKAGDKGRIQLPLSPDYDERPRQKVDFKQGKEAVTDYEVTAVHADGTADVLFHPVTGRTHQLRVHSAHHLGLGRPIVGDLLYGAHTIDSPSVASGRLCLHAAKISFTHPVSGRQLEVGVRRTIHPNHFESAY